MTRLPAATTLHQRLFALAVATAVTASVCAANLGLAQGYASRDAAHIAQTAAAVHAAAGPAAVHPADRS